MVVNQNLKAGQSGGGGITQITGVVLASNSWTLVSGLYESSYSNAAILSTHSVEAIPNNSTIDIVIACEMLPQNDSSAGSVKFYAKKQPLGAINLTLNLASAS